MNTKQILFTIAIIAAISPAAVAAPVMAQNMTGGNMTGGNMTGKISDWRHLTPQEAAKCTPPEVEVSEGKCGIDQSRQGNGSADSAAATAADDDDGGDTNSGDGGDTDSGDGGGQDQSEDDEEQKEG